MKKRDWLIVFFPLVMTWSLDRISKQWAITISGIKSFGIFGFILHHNPGAMLGLFSDLPPLLRIVTLSTGGAFLVCIYALIQYILPIRSLSLRIGLSILLGGILGNVTDRIIWGHVVDFIVVGTVSMSSPAFNVADALQWVGYALIVYAILKEGDLLWPEHNSRKRHWVNPKFQLKYCFILMTVGLGIGLISMVFAYTYLRVTMIDLVGNNAFILDKFLIPFVYTFFVISIGFSAGLFTIGKIISHKIAGPIYAFELFLVESMAGKNRPFRLRKKDEFQHLEALALRIQTQLIEHGIVPPAQNAPIPTAEEAEAQGAMISQNIKISTT